MYDLIYNNTKKIIKAIWYIVWTPLYLMIDLLLPIDKRIVLFGAWNGLTYSDNPKYIFEYAKNNMGSNKAYWITKSSRIYNELRSIGMPVAKAYSVSGIILQLFSGKIVYTHAAEWEFVPFLIRRSAIKILTWHGVPIKKIGYDAMSLYEKYGHSIKQVIAPYTLHRHTYYLSCGNEDSKIYETAFKAQTGQTFISGYPRNDALFKGLTIYKKEVEKIKVIYMPTLRGKAYSEFELLKKSNVHLKQLDGELNKRNVELLIKLHPVNILSEIDRIQIELCECIRVIEPRHDLYGELSSADILVTDISGVMVDFLVLNKPIINFIPDYHEYIEKDRELYHELPDIVGDHFCEDWNDVIASVDEIINCNLSVGPKQLALMRKYHKYMDGLSSERAWRIISNL